MPFDLNAFRNKLSHGGARPSQFEMQIFWPTAVPLGRDAELDFRFLCSIAEIPGSTIGNIKVPYFGRQLYYAGDRDFEPLTVTVINDEDFKVRHALEEWMRAITGHSSTVSEFGGGISAADASGMTTYVAEAQVIQYSRNGSGGGPTQAYRFVGLWPAKLGAIPLNWGTLDDIETFTCQFLYQWWEPIDASTGASISVSASL